MFEKSIMSCGMYACTQKEMHANTRKRLLVYPRKESHICMHSERATICMHSRKIAWMHAREKGRMHACTREGPHVCMHSGRVTLGKNRRYALEKDNSALGKITMFGWSQ